MGWSQEFLEVRTLQRIRKSRLARQFATLLGGRFAAALIQASSIYLLARWANVDDFGLLAAALGVAVTLQAIGDAGATTYIVREVAIRGINRSVAYAELLSRLVIMTVAMMAALIVLFLWMINGREYLALLPMVGWIVADRSSDIRSAIARGLGDVRIGTINIVARRLVQLGLFSGAYYCGLDAPWAYSMSLLVGSILVLIVMWKNLPVPPRILIRVRYLRLAFLRCKPYWVHTAATQIRNVDAAIVGALAGATQAAYYGVGARLMTPLRMVPATLATALLPHLVKRGESGSKDVAFGAAVAALIAVPYLVLVLVAPWLTKYLGESYIEATIPLQIMCVGLAGASFISIFNAILQARGHAHMVASISVSTAFLFLVLVCAGAWLQGAVGAALAFLVATYVQAVLVFQRARKDA